MEKVLNKTHHNPSRTPNPSHLFSRAAVVQAHRDAHVHRAVPPMLLREAPILQSFTEQRLADGVLARAFGPLPVALVQRPRLPAERVGYRAALHDEASELIVLGLPVVVRGGDLRRLIETNAPPLLRALHGPRQDALSLGQQLPRQTLVYLALGNL